MVLTPLRHRDNTWDNAKLKLLHSPVVPHLPLYEWVRLIHLLVSQHNADSVSPLWVQLF